MKYKSLFVSLAIIGLSVTADAQKLEFSKKEGSFKNGEQAVATLQDVKIKGHAWKDYYVVNAKGDTLISYRYMSATDTLGGADFQYYIAKLPTEQIEFTRGLFMDNMNTFRNVGDEVINNELLTPDGTIDNRKAQYYAAKHKRDILSDFFNRQDSIVKLITIPAPPPVARNTRKPVEVDRLGKIGQDNAVIGYWEEYHFKGEINELCFVFKNKAGGIVAVSWHSLSTMAHGYLFKGGVRIKDENSAFSFPLGGQSEAYVQKAATYLVSKGLL